MDDDLREEYDFSAEELSSAERGRYARRKVADGRLIDPDAVERAGEREYNIHDDLDGSA